MAAARLNRLSTVDLVAEFTQIAIRQGDNLLGGSASSYNRLFDKMRAIELELKGRPGDQRSALLPLLMHENLAVRWKASVATLAIAPALARESLEAVVNAKYMPISGHASSTLHYYDNGIFKPT